MVDAPPIGGMHLSLKMGSLRRHVPLFPFIPLDPIGLVLL